MHGLNPEVVETKVVSRDDLLIHDERVADPSLAFLLSRMRYPDFPEPLGVFRDVEQERYGNIVRRQNEAAVAKHGPGDLQKLITGDETWTVN
jgi:2-oxoglutarate ferredoxin oxidoreductase subunit beta